ncbi:MAG: hypothetical protein PGN16_04365 [Sphingomonas phyllosphaerae]
MAAIITERDEALQLVAKLRAELTKFTGPRGRGADGRFQRSARA